MATNSFKVVKLSFAIVLFAIAIWLVVEDVRRPPAESALSYARGIVDSVSTIADRTRSGYQTGQRTIVRLRGDSRKYTFLSKQPGFGHAFQVGDELEMRFDSWFIPHPDSFEVYAFTVNGKTIASYDETVAAQSRGSFACTAVLFVLLGFGALATTSWGTKEQEASYRKLRWIRSLLGR